MFHVEHWEVSNPAHDLMFHVEHSLAAYRLGLIASKADG